MKRIEYFSTTKYRKLKATLQIFNRKKNKNKISKIVFPKTDVKDFNVFEFSVSRKTDIFVHFDKLTYISVYIYTYVTIHLMVTLILQVLYDTGCPKKHGNSVTNWISS